MQPVAAGLNRFHTPTTQAAPAQGCRAVRSCSEPVADEPSRAQIRSVKKALMQQVVATLRARLEVSVTAPAKVAGLSDDEQAGNQLASAVSSALQGASSSQAVRDSIQGGLEEAKRSLQDCGASADDLDSALSDLTSKIDNLFAAFTPPASTSEVVAAGARVVTREKGVLEIRTQEGDVVKVKFSTKTDARAGIAQISTDDGLAASSSLSVSTRSRTQLSVDGDLNDEEIQAIAAVVQKVDALANDFFAGNVDEALAKAADLDIDTEQLADVALRLSVKQRVEAHAVSVAQPVNVTSPADTLPPVNTIVDPEVSPPSTLSPVARDDVSLPAPAEQATETAPSTQSPVAQTQTDSPQAVVAKFVARMMVDFQSSAGDSRVSLSFKMKLQLLTSAIEARQPEATPAAGVKKLCDVAEAAAAQAEA